MKVFWPSLALLLVALPGLSSGSEPATASCTYAGASPAPFFGITLGVPPLPEPSPVPILVWAGGCLWDTTASPAGASRAVPEGTAVQVTINDASGLPVYGRFCTERVFASNGCDTADGDIAVAFCGTSPVIATPEVDIRYLVFLYVNAGCPGATAGTMDITIW